MTMAAHSTEVVRQSVIDEHTLGQRRWSLIEDLYPICRSITGNGFRSTMARIQKEIPLAITEVPSGTQVFDWTVPKEWNIRDAYVRNSKGERVVDFRKHNLHVVNYSAPIHRHMSLAELRPYLHTLPDHPDWIPYRTSYYKESWGFCITHRQLQELREDDYEVCIESTLQDGHLTYGECYLPGEVKDEILVSCHACHPSLCNDNLSGIAVAVSLAKQFLQERRRYSYRFLFIPGTIGSITWLALNQDRVSAIKHGLVLTCVGDRGSITYKKSRRGNAEIDRVMAYVLQQAGQQYSLQEFSPYGYDERQYCSPGFNLAVGCLMRTPHGCFPEYHTSADNLSFIDAASLEDTFTKCRAAFHVIENNRTYISLNQKCEPQLGKRGLYKDLGGRGAQDMEMALLWVMNLSDGGSTLLDIAERSKVDFAVVCQAAQALCRVGLLKELAE